MEGVVDVQTSRLKGIREWKRGRQVVRRHLERRGHKLGVGGWGWSGWDPGA